MKLASAVAYHVIIFLNFTSGVPLGSNLGPFFILFINDVSPYQNYFVTILTPTILIFFLIFAYLELILVPIAYFMRMSKSFIIGDLTPHKFISHFQPVPLTNKSSKAK